MASRRRSAEERNLKTLRELAGLPANKQCFDCHQRGPTYINVTIGSFVCTSCSGILRGLTPPHRVKSITMTTFSPEEIEFLKNRGNEYCRRVWLGTYDSHSHIENEGRDEHKTKEMMVQKYEKKRWYVDPEIAMKLMQRDQSVQQIKQKPVLPPTNNVKPQNKVPETQPLSNLLGKSTTPLVVQDNQLSDEWPHPVSSASASTVMPSNTLKNQGSSSFDLLTELGASAFSSPTSATAVSTANGNFANFETAFSSEKSETELQPSCGSSNSLRKAYTPPAGWTSFDDDLAPLSSTLSSSSSYAVSVTVSHAQTNSAMPRPLSLPTFAPTNPFKCPAFVSSPSASSASQWSSFTATVNASTPSSVKPVSSSTMDSAFVVPKGTTVFSSPPATESANLPQTKAAQPDRYAALADLDSLFNQPAMTSPSWTVEPVVTTSVSAFELPKFTPVNSTSSAPSNPFTSVSSSWSQPQVNNSQRIAFTSPNPFQSAVESELPFQPQKASQNYAPFPIPVVGDSPSEDRIRAQFNISNNNTPFAPFVAADVSSPTNGFQGNQIYMQNGSMFSNSTSAWGIPSMAATSTTSAAWPVGQSTVSAVDKLGSDWSQNTANPFMAGPNIMGLTGLPKTNPSNPFL